MGQEQQDYLMRQIQTVARGLGKFFGIEAIKEIIGPEELQNSDMTEDEIDTLILMTKVENIMHNRELSPHHLSVEIGISILKMEKLFSNERCANNEEFKKLHTFIDHNEEYL